MNTVLSKYFMQPFNINDPLLFSIQKYILCCFPFSNKWHILDSKQAYNIFVSYVTIILQ